MVCNIIEYVSISQWVMHRICKYFSQIEKHITVRYSYVLWYRYTYRASHFPYSIKQRLDIIIDITNETFNLRFAVQNFH